MSINFCFWDRSIFNRILKDLSSAHKREVTARQNASVLSRHPWGGNVNVQPFRQDGSSVELEGEDLEFGKVLTAIIDDVAEEIGVNIPHKLK